MHIPLRQRLRDGQRVTWSWEYIPSEEYLTAGAPEVFIAEVEAKADELVWAAHTLSLDGTTYQGAGETMRTAIVASGFFLLQSGVVDAHRDNAPRVGVRVVGEDEVGRFATLHRGGRGSDRDGHALGEVPIAVQELRGRKSGGRGQRLRQDTRLCGHGDPGAGDLLLRLQQAKCGHDQRPAGGAVRVVNEPSNTEVAVPEGADRPGVEQDHAAASPPRSNCSAATA